jgi:hypothetical protein
MSGFDVIRSLIDEIRLVSVDGELRIEIKGELAGILELCQEGAKAKPGSLSTAGLAQQIKMVAGARNHLYRTNVIALSRRDHFRQGRPRPAGPKPHSAVT